MVQPPEIAQISAAIVGSDGSRAPEEWDDYKYYPQEWFEPYLGRRRANGMDLYRSLEIGRKDKDGYDNFINQNYAFFGAPVGLIVTLDRRLEKGAWVDLGMFLQNVLLVAAAHGWIAARKPLLRRTTVLFVPFWVSRRRTWWFVGWHWATQTAIIRPIGYKPTAPRLQSGFSAFNPPP